MTKLPQASMNVLFGPSSIPRHPVIKPGTLRQILDAADLTADQFKDLL